MMESWRRRHQYKPRTCFSQSATTDRGGAPSLYPARRSKRITMQLEHEPVLRVLKRYFDRLANHQLFKSDTSCVNAHERTCISETSGVQSPVPYSRWAEGV